MSAKHHVLVIDDEPPICGMLDEYFGKHGFRVTTSLSGMDGMKLVDNTPFDVVILDIALGEVDGLELLGLIKERHPHLPVVMLTGLGYDEELLSEARRKNASGYVSKNLPLEHLLLEIRHVLRTPATVRI